MRVMFKRRSTHCPLRDLNPSSLPLETKLLTSRESQVFRFHPFLMRLSIYYQHAVGAGMVLAPLQHLLISFEQGRVGIRLRTDHAV